MKKVQFKLKNKTRAFSLAMLATLVLFTGCNSYDDEIADLKGQIDAVVTDVATLKTSVAGLQTSVSGMTYIKSITMGTDGKLTITPSVGTAIIYDAKNYVTYDIKLEGNNLIVNGANKGSVVIPPLTFENGVLKSGTAVVADLTAWMKSGLTVVDGFLAINGQKTTVAIPVAPGKTVADVTLDGTNVKVTYTDGSNPTFFANAPIVTGTSATGTLTVNGVDTGVKITNVYELKDGYLWVNGVKTTVAIPAPNTSNVVMFRDADGILSATITDATGATTTVKVNPSTELLSSLVFVPSIIEAGVNTVDYGYVLNELGTAKVLFGYEVLRFRFNPSSANVSKTVWSFLANAAEFRAPGVTGVDVPNLFDVPAFTDKSGHGEFVMKAVSDPWAGVDATNAVTGIKRLVMLQASSDDFYDKTKKAIVTSDYVKLQPVAYAAKIVKKANNILTPYHTQASAPTLVSQVPTVDITVQYDGSAAGRDINLADTVHAAGHKVGSTTLALLKDLKFGDLNKDYKFEFDDDFVVKGTDDTDQNVFGSVTTPGMFTIAQGAASQDRNPIVRVKLLAIPGNQVLATAYIRINIVKPGVPPPPPPANVNYTYPETDLNIAYTSLFTAANANIINDTITAITVPWLNMNQKVYNKIGVNGLSHNDFVALYGDPTKTTLTVSATHQAEGAATSTAYTAAERAKAFKLFRSENGPNFDTYAMSVKVTPYAKFGTNIVTYKYTPNDVSKPVVTINIKFIITKPAPAVTIIPAYLYQGDGVRVQGTKPGGVYQQQVYLGEGHGYNNGASYASYNGIFGTATGKVDSAFHKLSFADKYVKNAIPSLLLTPSSATDGTATSINAIFGTAEGTGPLLAVNPANVIDIPVRDYVISLTSTYPNGQTSVTTWKAYFINPLTITAAGNYTLTDLVTPDTKNVSTNYTVTDLGATIANPALAYALTVNNYQGGGAYPLSFVDPNLIWNNSGTRLQQTVLAGSLKATYSTTYATISVDNSVTVNPSTGNFVKRK